MGSGKADGDFSLYSHIHQICRISVPIVYVLWILYVIDHVKKAALGAKLASSK